MDDSTRHPLFDHIGLLRPERVDPFTGYRSYGPSQLDRANRLVALKDLGFTLEEVGQMLVGSGSHRVAELLRGRRSQLRTQLSEDGRRLRLVEARLRSIEKETAVHPFTETALPPLRLAQLTAMVTEMAEIEDEVGPMFDRVAAVLAQAGISTAGPGVATYTDTPDGLVVATAEPIGDADVPRAPGRGARPVGRAGAGRPLRGGRPLRHPGGLAGARRRDRHPRAASRGQRP